MKGQGWGCRYKVLPWSGWKVAAWSRGQECHCKGSDAFLESMGFTEMSEREFRGLLETEHVAKKAEGFPVISIICPPPSQFCPFS